jgi:AcrR family transcriptional regulator
VPSVVPSADSGPPTVAAPGTADPAGTHRAAGVDGRTARAQRTRTAIVDALLDLLDEGELQPTAPRIAHRAGISQRLIYHHFGDLDSLFRAVAARQGQQIAAVSAPIDPALPLSERIDALLDQRIAVLELITPVRRAGLRHEPYSDGIQQARRRLLAAGRRQIAHVFAPELARVPEPEREEIAHGLQAMLAWGCWNDLLAGGRSPAEARTSLRAVLDAVLTPLAGPR